jgi:aldehyde:ferredoxin oxidoreductase
VSTGVFGRLLRIDLNRGTHRYEEIPRAVLERSLGGKGLGARYLLDENPPGVDPLSPESRFFIATGPLTGTRMWSQSRFAVFAKSPATGGFGESYCGGTLAPKIKGCGVDLVVLEGVCPQLSTLLVDEEGASLRPAPELQGAESFAAEEALLSRAPEGAGAMVIGPAGERRVRLSCIKSDRWRSLGRGGLGAVLGAKNLKGIAFAGRRRAEVADAGLLRQVLQEVSGKGKQSPVTEVYYRYGTASQVRVTNQQGCFPTRYWQSGTFEHWQKLSADYMQDHFEVQRHGCPNCFLQCTKLCRVREGRHRGLEIEGPEYETIYAFGGLCCIDSLEEVAYLNDLCDRLGLDTMSAGNLAGFAIEARRRGKIDFAIDFNQPDRVAELLRRIAAREGIGDLLARGIREAAAELDLEEVAVHVKGLEPAGFDPRVLKGMGLSYATAARGACHLRGAFYKAELSGQINPQATEGKAALVIDYEDRAALFDCLILCRFFRDFILWDELSRLIAAATGRELSKAQLERLANRVTQDCRAYNRREGLDASTDTLPPRLLREANAQGARFQPGELERMLEDYNTIRRGRDDNAGA